MQSVGLPSQDDIAACSDWDFAPYASADPRSSGKVSVQVEKEAAMPNLEHGWVNKVEILISLEPDIDKSC